MRIYGLLGGIGIFATMSVSAYFLKTEYASLLFNAKGRTVQVARLTDGDTGHGVAYRSKLETFFVCNNVMSNITFGLLTADQRDGIRTTCRGLAQAALRTSPELGYAHYIEAVALSDQPSSDAFSSALLSALTNARYVQWQAEQRLGLALKYYDQAPEVAQQVIANDIPNVIQYHSGRDVLTRLYKTHGATKTQGWEQATRAIEAAPAEFQRRFIGQLKSSLRN